ncbi:hypothetical protein [Halalkalibacter urbisdiaboli]|uniref:hypothetical protein n=1 Tax=Halalkalibacter urbisdiaboli TaxID=1960589 RepID=UPI000B44F223|nr:hypothetical protein [Halalkalibacter urbisdiaboli]
MFIVLSILVCLTFLGLLSMLILLKRQQYTLQLLHALKQEIETLKMNPSSLSIEHEALLNESRSHLLLLAYRVRDAVYKQQSTIHARLIEEAPTSHGYSDKELAKLFPPQAVLATQQFWHLYNEYLSHHWLDSKKHVKTIFSGRKEDHTSELGQMHIASNRLITKLDHLLEKMKSAP